MNTAFITRITRIIALGGLLFVTACSPGAISLFGIGLPAKPTATPAPVASREARVQSVEIRMEGSDPVRVTAVVRGELSEACAQLEQPQLTYANNTFMVTLLAVSPSDRGCAQVITPFEQAIPLDTAGLEAGEYAVKANGVSGMFTLTAAPAAPEGPRTFTSSLYGYQVSLPAGWSFDVNTSVPAGPGSDPEYVTFKTADPANLPRIEIEALTGEPPMVGYEDCQKNFEFRSLPACQISLPAGQNPATEIWVFQNGQANFFIAMQYEDPDSIRLFNDFLTSFEFTR